MKIALISFTQHGMEICDLVMNHLNQEGHACEGFVKGSFPNNKMTAIEESLSEWTERVFEEMDSLIFVGATGIAVRAIAPYLKGKTMDPAVLVMDEKGQYVIPLISGHIGGANKLALEIADKLNAIPILTTATDINGKFAIDQWAKEQSLFIKDMTLAKKVAVYLLQNKPVGFTSQFPVKGKMPIGMTGKKVDLNVVISVQDKLEEENILQLIPRLITLGIGCKRGIAGEKIRTFVKEVLREENISLVAIKQVASIDLKENEAGLIGFCKDNDFPFKVFTAKELSDAKGDFSKSAFVKQTTGVDNVCERAAVLASNGKILIKKRAKDGVTVALAIETIEYAF